MTSSLVVENLNLARAGRDIFRIDKLGLRRGEVLALVGPNGAGKTSLLLTLALLQAPTSGDISFDGVVAGNGNVLSLRRRMAVVFQDALLLDTTVFRNLVIPLRIRGVVKDQAAERAEKWLNRFGIAHLASRKARHLSGGEAQRASLARAFALEPEFLFLDEPLGALDYPTRKALLGELGQILKDMHITTLFVTHDFTEIPYLASMVAVLYEGRLVKYGTVREVFGEQLLESKVWTPWEVD
jgi:tungstate transport system ATP-binding protein